MATSLNIGDPSGPGNPYTLTLVNNSASPWKFYVFQKMPDQDTANVFSLAWFCSDFMVMPTTKIAFTWTIDYSMVWGAVGTIIPGVTFQASGVRPANLKSANKSSFKVQPGPDLSVPTAGTPSGSLVISDDSDVPANMFSVGIGMSGTGTFVTHAGPNLLHTFTPTPTYYVAAGTNVEVGTILEITTVNPDQQVIFPDNVYSLTYALNQANLWEKQ